MDNRGEFLLTVFAGIVIVLTITGAVVTLSKGNTFYVGDKESHLFYNYRICSSNIEKIDSDARVIFESEDMAIKNGFKPAKECI